MDFIVMECVEGQTLDQRIGHRGMRLNEALNCAVQIADALAKAHSAGIVHRDLKPTNIMVNESGVVKVLDFGLAKLTEQVQGDEFASTATVDEAGKPITEEGVIVGTVAYMSPGQAEGKKVDARSDVFSLGSVLYEMVTGQKAFQGKSKMSTLSAILREEPTPVGGITPAIPADLEKLINRCLRKDPAKRFQQMDDVKVTLDELKEESDSGRLAAAVPPIKRNRHRFLAALLALPLLIAAGWLFLNYSGHKSPPPTLVQLTSYPGSELYPCFSPDGRQLAYASCTSIWSCDVFIQQLDSNYAPRGDPRRITRQVLYIVGLAWSRDGGSLVCSGSWSWGMTHRLWRVGSSGGQQPERLDLAGFQATNPSFAPMGGRLARFNPMNVPAVAGIQAKGDITLSEAATDDPREASQVVLGPIRCFL